MDELAGLRATDVTVAYGGVVANDSVSVRVDPGRVVGLIGPNGAGKTTFIDALTGFAPAVGLMTVDGARVDGLPAFRRRRQGLARTWQAGELFSSLSILENVLVASDHVGWGTALLDLVGRRHDNRRVALRTLKRVGLDGYADATPEEMSLGLQRLVGVARALAGDPRVLLLDEPAAGLDSLDSQSLGRAIREVADSGVAVLLIEHDMELIFGVCDQIVVLDFGRVIYSGDPGGARKDAAVLSAYLGAAPLREEQ